MGLLQEARAKAESSVPSQYRKSFDAIMAAGLKMMFSEQTFPEMKRYIATIKSPDDVPRIVAHGITKLLSLLINGLKKKFPFEPYGAAMIVLMTHALEYVERVMKIQITPDMLAETTRLVSQGHLLMLKQATGLNDAQFQQVMAGRGKELIDQSKQTPPQNGTPPAGAGGL